MDITMLFKIAGVGILVTIVQQLLKQSGRDELATVAVVIGLIIGSLMMLSMLSGYMDSVKQTFSLF
ncbi:MAG: stage III sporulation protein AC [Clostridiales bacterium]|nr:stage III sporulation protein AC [Clostridiales bacterium]